MPIEPGRLVVREVPLVIPRWPAGMKPLRVAAIADVHTGAPHITLDRLREVVARTNAARPDLVVLLGDYVVHGVVGGRLVPPEPTAAVLRDLRAPLGVLAVLGNHDWWYDGARVGRALTDAGIPVLDDEAVALRTPGGLLWVAGVGDPWTRPASIGRALAAVPAGAPVIVLTHTIVEVR
ncbi:MAG TPA: metallophosphoesterase [Methylomirabilota bacterium]|nr:metallophosphoesterase [Methylomirabilota bacterium]